MKVEIEDSGPSKKTLKVTVAPDRVQQHLDKVYKAANQQVNIKGFRPGKVPRHVLRQRFGDAILAEAKESIINETFQEAMRDNALDVVGQPKLDVDEEPLQEDAELSYTVEFELRPQVKVGSVKAIELTRKSTEATEDDIEGALADLAKSKRKLQSVDEELEPTDFAKVDICYKLDGAEIVKKEGLQINPGIPVRGCDADEFRGKLVGQHKGDTVTVPIKYPDTFENEDARDKEGEVEIVIHEIMRFVTPPIDDEFAQGFEFESLDTLKSDIEAKISAEKARMEDQRLEEEVLDALYAENPFDLPEGLVDDEIKHRTEHFVEDFKRQGASEEEAKERVKEGKAEIEDISRKGVRNLFLVEGIMKKEKLFVTESDVEAELKRIATENQTTLVEVRKYVEEKKVLPEIRVELMNRKVRDFLRTTATITDSTDADSGAAESS